MGLKDSSPHVSRRVTKQREYLTMRYLNWPWLVLRDRSAFWETVRTRQSLLHVDLVLILFIIVSSAIYGAVLAVWRSPILALYVAAKLPILLLGTTCIVAVLNWLTAAMFRSGLGFRQTLAVTFGAMSVSCWILLSLVPVTLFFTFFAADRSGTHDAMRLTHNCLLVTHIVLIAMAGVAGNVTLRAGLRSVVLPGCDVRRLYWSWIVAFAVVGCQLSWILRPFVGSPFFPIVFMRPDCFDRNFFEFIFTEVLPYMFGLRS